MSQPRRTVTRDEPSLVIRGGDRMSFFKPDESPKPSYPVRVYVAPGSVMNVPPHFHITHDELFHVEQGEVQITQNGVAKTYNASSGEIIIPRGTVHSILVKASAHEPVIAWERTDPEDQEKELMFRVMDSIMLDSPTYQKKGRPGFVDALQMNLTFYTYDTYLAPLPTWTGAIGRKLDLLIDGALAWVANSVGYKAIYPEYVSEELREAVLKGQKSL